LCLRELNGLLKGDGEIRSSTRETRAVARVQIRRCRFDLLDARLGGIDLDEELAVVVVSAAVGIGASSR
jgi:hypothetical protein